MEPRPLGLRLILLYKFAKGPIFLLTAGWLLHSPEAALALGTMLVSQISERGPLLHRLAAWLGLHLNLHDAHVVALATAVDGSLSLLEGMLLLSGKKWAEWIVVGSVGSLLPFEILALVHKLTALRVLTFAVNLAIFGYLVRDRLRKRGPITP